MNRIKQLGVSPLTGNIYYGTVDTDKNVWIGNKTDVTEMACRVVAEHLFKKKKKMVFQLEDGRNIALSVEVLSISEQNFKKDE